MTRSVALYEALIQANVPQPAARRVVDALEADMTSSLPTKQDVALLDQHLAGLDQRVVALDERLVERFAAARRELDLKLDGLETRLLVKLGGLMAVLAGVLAALQRIVG